jgi:VanZ family protein
MIKRNKFSILISLVILYLSLANAETFESTGLFDIPYLDKFTHFGLYFFFMAVIILEHKDFFGGLMELFQSVTPDRKADILDIMFNSAGTATAVCIWLFYKPYYKDQIR